jgi:hypothetical protein
VLFVLIAVAWSIFIVFGFAMFRVAALSDESHAIAVGQSLAAAARDQAEASRAERVPAEPWQAVYRKAV